MGSMELLERRVKPRRPTAEQPEPHAEQRSMERGAAGRGVGKGTPEAGLVQLSEAAALLSFHHLLICEFSSFSSLAPPTTQRERVTL
ncbi:hypothetical protein SRHO_G00209840 [Serrasalmus rhombeus]